MPLRLPPLNSLRFFEAAARLGSFKLAAAELNVTPSAVSHGIVALEETLGVALFTREPRKLSLTPAGELYFPYIAEAFSLILLGTQRLPDGRTHRKIAVSCAPTLAVRWLVPRLHDFRTQWPSIDVSVDTSRRQVGFPIDGFDFGIRLSRGPVPGSDWNRLFGEQLVPVCSPAYRETLRDAHGSVDLRRATLIHVDTASDDWQAWLDGAGIVEIDATGGLRFDTIQLALEAATTGMGVAIGRRPLVDRELDAGALVEASTLCVDAKTSYWLVSAESADGTDERPELQAFRRWILHEALAFQDAAQHEATPTHE